jgi:hypothetical protein
MHPPVQLLMNRVDHPSVPAEGELFRSRGRAMARDRRRAALRELVASVVRPARRPRPRSDGSGASAPIAAS